jgi:hypothetical protein
MNGFTNCYLKDKSYGWFKLNQKAPKDYNLKQDTRHSIFNPIIEWTLIPSGSANHLLTDRPNRLPLLQTLLQNMCLNQITVREYIDTVYYGTLHIL